jgi:putative N6-adenine-specific DNA methylase
MCGSGTILLEAADIAVGLRPGRSRSFAFETLPSAQAGAIADLRAPGPAGTPPPLWGQDRDDGAIRMATQNAERAGLQDHITFARRAITATERPDGPPGIVLVNPPYGARIGNRKLLFALYGSFGTLMREQFQGWRVGLVTSDKGLARATELPWRPPTPPIAHGPLKIHLFQTDPL